MTYSFFFKLTIGECKERSRPLITSEVNNMAFISIQNTLSTFLTLWHLFHVQGVKFPSQVSRRKIYDVNLVLASLRPYVVKYNNVYSTAWNLLSFSVLWRSSRPVLIKSSNISRRHLYDVIIFSMTRYVVVITLLEIAT